MRTDGADTDSRRNDPPEDPVPDRVPGQEVLYGAIQAAWSAWARRRFRDEFDRVTAFALFVGYPRSGHSLVGAMLNAHRQAIISHELDAPKLVLAGIGRDELYSRILARAAWFNLRGNTSNYSYQIPNSWQGRFETLRVIGDKGGGWAVQWLRRHPHLLQSLHSIVGVPIRMLHVVRNPWDNIAAISRWHRLPLGDSIDFYFSHCETTADLTGRDDVLTVRHEDFIAQPVVTLASVCAFVGLEPGEAYLEDCSSIVFDRPTGSRRRVHWSDAQVRVVAERARAYPFLEGYSFTGDDVTADPSESGTGTEATGMEIAARSGELHGGAMASTAHPRHEYDADVGGNERAARSRRTVRPARPPVLRRLAAWINPQVRPHAGPGDGSASR
jgi:Sulfotransferase family